ncbi:hypothetical protein M3I54_31300 [Paraburkholderia sp. CNPSo 3274]|uniref:hypothetical protein n=1 Tax=Paraburkholderia sp. CNPSo 3274 TaxID=2940932 RepID=UPI0020B7BB16|nr:hypothetical protein [Paraburkholderia sp. CNPSo 3274]MCP3711399.1 hypothetical protein [Paraburkholderia sp. CNPSo 3274]
MVNFRDDISRLFRQKDIEAMRKRIDLSSFESVSLHATDILDRLIQGDMPCDGQWAAEKIALFRQWIDEGKNA